MNKSNCCFISSNVKGMKSSGTRIKVFEYLKQKINQNGYIYARNTLLHRCWKKLAGRI